MKIILSEKQLDEIIGGSYFDNNQHDYHKNGSTEVMTSSHLNGEYSPEDPITNDIGDVMSNPFQMNGNSGMGNCRGAIASLGESKTKRKFEIDNNITMNEDKAEMSKKKLKASPTSKKKLDNTTRKDSTVNSFINGDLSFDALKSKVKRIKRGESVNDSLGSNEELEKEYERQKTIRRNSNTTLSQLDKLNKSTKFKPITFTQNNGIKGRNDVGIITYK